MLIIVDAVHRRMFGTDAVLTSGTDGEHKHFTHALGYAGDFRSRDHSPTQRSEFVKAVSMLLGPDYQFFHEEKPAHYHGEYDPRAEKELVA